MQIKKKICFIASVDFAILVYLYNHIKVLSSIYDITVIVNTYSSRKLTEALDGCVTVIHVPFARKPKLVRDFISLVKLVLILLKNRFDIVHSIMPKTGLIAMCAAFITHIPIRIHTFTGQVWVTRRGLSRAVLKQIDRLICFLCTHVLADSKSQKNFLISEGVITEDKITVLANGSICGVDTKRFKPNSVTRSNMRAKLNIPENAFIFLFVGRFNKDKGICDLAEAFSKLASVSNNAWLLLVGPDEDGVLLQVNKICKNCLKRIVIEGFTDVPEYYMAAADVFCLASYREGFGSVIIEAAASGIPSIGTNIYGLTDAIEDGVSGVLYPPGDIQSLVMVMNTLMNNNEMYKAMASSARKRAINYFATEIVTKAMEDYYSECLGL